MNLCPQTTSQVYTVSRRLMLPLLLGDIEVLSSLLLLLLHSADLVLPMATPIIMSGDYGCDWSPDYLIVQL